MKAKVVCIAIFLLMISTSFAGVNESLAAMKKRLPQIVALKKSKAIGENNQGYLTVLKSSPQTAVVAAENSDRKVIYLSVAKKHGISVSQVGKQRAASIHKKASKGTMIQDSSGNWRSK